MFTESAAAADSTVIMLIEEDGTLHTRATLGLSEEIVHGFTLSIGEGFSGKIAAERRPLLLRSSATDPLVKSPYVHEQGLRALYGVPCCSTAG